MGKALVAAVATGVMLMGTPALGNAPAGPAPLTRTAASTLRTVLKPLTGSKKMLVFSRHIDGVASIYARSRTGHLTSLGVVPKAAERYSVVGTVVAAARFEHYDESVNVPTTSVAYLWRTTTGRRSIVHLPAGAAYLAAAPAGIIYAARGGAVRVRKLDGRSTTLAFPFGHHPSSMLWGTANAAGVVVSDNNDRAAYIRLAAPHKVTRLNPPSKSLITCEDIVGAYAACTVDGFDDEFIYPASAFLLPLDGGPAIEARKECNLGRVAMSTATLLWTCAYEPGNKVEYHLSSQRAGSQAVEAGGTTGIAMTSAYGKAIVQSADQATLLSATSADDRSVLVK